MTFLVVAHYATDDGLTERRARVRDEHIRHIRESAEEGRLIVAGAILNDAETPVGSALVAEFASKEALQAFLESDIYSRERVWERFEIHPLLRAV